MTVLYSILHLLVDGLCAMAMFGRFLPGSDHGTDHVALDQETDRIVPEPDHGTAVFVTALVVLVVLATAALLVVLRKRKA